MRHRRLCPALLLALLLGTPAASAQERQQVEQRLGQLQSQIGEVQRNLASTRQEEQSALVALDQVETEITLREALVSTYRERLDQLSSESNALRNRMSTLENEIETSRRTYQTRARQAYMRGRINDLALIFSSGSFNQMVVRARYLRRFAQDRTRQIDRIRSRTRELALRQEELGATLGQTREMLSESEAQQRQLAGRRNQRQQMIADLRNRRSEVEAELQTRQNAAAQLESEVRRLIAEDMRRREAEEAARRAEARRIEEARQAEEARRAEEARLAAARRAEEERIAEARRPATTRNPAPTTRSETQPQPPPPPPTREEPAPPPPRTAPPPPRTTAPPPTDAYVTLTGSFRQNRGRLPWPSEGVVTGNFGVRRHAVYGTQTTSPGIDIATRDGADVRAVFEGVVNRIGSMPAFGTYVMVSHGEYTTIYGNLSQVSVSQGQNIRAGQALGRAGYSDDRRGAGVFFALFSGTDAVDPTGWLRAR